MLDLTPEYKAMGVQLDLLKKEFSDLFTAKNEMLTYEEPFLTARYLELIGGKKYEIYCLQVELAMQKQYLERMMVCINQNKSINLNKIEKEINDLFAEHQARIAQEAQTLASAKEFLKSSFLSEEEMIKIKTVYRLIVKKLHPDINPSHSEHDKELLLKAQAAYELCDLQALNEILVAIDLPNPSAIKEMSTPDMSAYLTKMEENVSKLKQQIQELELKFPFNLRSKLANEEWIAMEQEAMETEISALKSELEKKIQTVVALKLWKPASLN